MRACMNARLTWQATSKNKFTFHAADFPRHQDGAYMTGTRTYEASIDQFTKMGRMFQGVWKSPVTSRLMLEGTYADVAVQNAQNPVPGVGPDVISVMDLGTGILS